MTTFTIIRYLHFLGIFLFVSSLFAELILIKPVMSRTEITRLSKIDGLYGMSTLLVLSAGLSMWFWVGKPANFYSGNPVFMVKLALFAAVGTLSAWPTIFFIRNRKGVQDELVQFPKMIKISLLIEFVLVLGIPLLAVLMAQGITF